MDPRATRIKLFINRTFMDKKTIVISDIICNAVHERVNRDASQSQLLKLLEEKMCIIGARGQY